MIEKLFCATQKTSAKYTRFAASMTTISTVSNVTVQPHELLPCNAFTESCMLIENIFNTTWRFHMLWNSSVWRCALKSWPTSSARLVGWEIKCVIFYSPSAFNRFCVASTKKVSCRGSIRRRRKFSSSQKIQARRKAPLVSVWPCKGVICEMAILAHPSRYSVSLKISKHVKLICWSASMTWIDWAQVVFA